MNMLGGLTNWLKGRLDADSTAKPGVFNPPGVLTIPGSPALADPLKPPVQGDPASFSRLQGAARMYNAQTTYNYEPWFAGLGRQVDPQVVNMPKGLLGEYNPGANDVRLAEGTNEYVTPTTHELLHAAYQRHTPAAQQAFLQMVQANITPTGRDAISHKLAARVYGNTGPITDFTQLPQNLATEVHSYLPQFEPQMSPAMRQYYAHYFAADPSIAHNSYGYQPTQMTDVKNLRQMEPMLTGFSPTTLDGFAPEADFAAAYRFRKAVTR